MNYDVLLFPGYWENVAKMSTRRFSPGMAVLNDKIYVAGGFGDLGHGSVCGVALRTVECFDPRTHTWSYVADMNIARYCHALVSCHGKLFAIGGRDVDGSYFENAEVYDPNTDTWTELHQKLEGKVAYTGASIIKKYALL